MKVRVLMATLVITLLLGVQGFANPCDRTCVDPCGSACNVVRGGDLFSGLKRLVNGVRANNCDPCEPVVACNPCDDAFVCNPCDDVCGTPRFNFGGRLRNLFSGPGCDDFGDCNPCDIVADCDPCGILDDGCSTPRFRPFRNLFNGLLAKRGCVTDCGPCDVVTDCDPCGVVDCNPCDDVCGDYCGPRGHLFDLPRLNLSRLFNGLRIARCDDGTCGPCDVVQPCDANCFR